MKNLTDLNVINFTKRVVFIFEVTYTGNINKRIRESGDVHAGKTN